jgi:hypothetical protein
MGRMPARKTYQTIKRVAMVGARRSGPWEKNNLSDRPNLPTIRNIFYIHREIVGRLNRYGQLSKVEGPMTGPISILTPKCGSSVPQSVRACVLHNSGSRCWRVAKRATATATRSLTAQA